MTEEEEFEFRARLEAEMSTGNTPGLSPAKTQAQARQGLIDGMAGAVPEIGRTAGRVAANIGAVVPLAIDAARYGVDKISGEDPPFSRAGKAYDEQIEAWFGRPASRSRQVGESVLAGAAGGAGVAKAVGGSVARSTVSGGMGALGGEAGGAAGEPFGLEVPGSIVGGLITGSPNQVYRGRGNLTNIVKDASKGLSDQDYVKAILLQKRARAAGIDLTPEQAFDQPTGFDTLVNETIRGGGGKGDLQSLVNKQPLQVEEVARKVGPGVGPKARSATDATRDLKESTYGAVDAEKQLSTSQRALYDDAGKTASGPQMDALQSKLAAMVEANAGSQETQTLIRDIQKRLAAVTEKTTITGSVPKLTERPGKPGKRLMLPTETSTELTLGADLAALDRIVKEAKATFTDMGIQTPGAAKIAQARYAAAAGEVEALLDDLITTRPQARDIARSAFERQDRLEAGLPGRVAGRKQPADAPDSLSAVKSALMTEKDQAVDISELGSINRERAARLRVQARQTKDDVLRDELIKEAQQAERAVPQAVRELWEESLTKAFKSKDGRTSPTVGSDIAAQWLTNEKNTRALVRTAMADSRGLTGPALKEAEDGFISLLKVMEASGRNRAGVPVSQADIRAGVGKSAVKTAVQLTQPLARQAVLSSTLRNIAMQKRYDELAGIFSSPDGIAKLRELANTPVMSSRASSIVASMLGGALTQGNLEPQQ